jgi:hypothetical protein
MPNKLYGLDETIVVGDRPTTIRKEWEAENINDLRIGERDDKTPRHLVIIDGEPFEVSEADFKTLRP